MTFTEIEHQLSQGPDKLQFLVNNHYDSFISYLDYKLSELNKAAKALEAIKTLAVAMKA